jgi:hypothetical protein
MRAFVLAVITALVLATAGAFVLECIQKTTEIANATTGARITPN